METVPANAGYRFAQALFFLGPHKARKGQIHGSTATIAALSLPQIPATKGEIDNAPPKGTSSKGTEDEKGTPLAEIRDRRFGRRAACPALDPWQPPQARGRENRRGKARFCAAGRRRALIQPSLILLQRPPRGFGAAFAMSDPERLSRRNPNFALVAETMCRRLRKFAGFAERR